MTLRLGAPALLLAVLAACSPAGADNHPHEQAQIAPATSVRVEVAEMRPSAATLDLSLPGEVEGGRDAVLASALGGLVERVMVGDGDEVRSGQVLVKVDADIYAAQVDQVAAQAALATSDLARVRGLGDLATAQQIQQAETQVTVLEAQLRGARAQLSRAVVRAPFSGIVTSVGVEKGEFVGPGQAIARVVQLNPVEVSLSVSDRDRVALSDGLPVDITTAGASGIFHGTVSHVGAAADLRTRAFTVKVAVPNDDQRLLPGMIARVAVHQSVADDALILPQDWIVTHLDGQGVYVEADGVAHWRPVTLGAVVRDQVIVTGGLAAGDRVVTTGHRELADGDPLLVVRAGFCCDAGRAVWEAAQ